MQVSIETTTGLERRLTVGIPAETVDQEVVKRLNDAAKTVRINGFRKGKVPFRVVKQRFGDGVRQEVLGDVIKRSFQEALQQESVRPAGQPSIEPKKMLEGQDVEFVATFEVYPEVSIQGLGDISVTKYDSVIEDADVVKMIESLQKNQASWEDFDGAAEEGSKVNVDFVGKKDGEAFEGGSAEKQDLEIGSKSMVPGFEDGIVGMKAGETKTVAVTFPDDYQSEELRGADAEFDITVNSIQSQKLPELNEEFFEKFGVSGGDESKFREDVKVNMEREKQKAIRNKIKAQSLDVLLEKNQVELPSALVSDEINAMRQQAAQQYGAAVENIDLSALLPDDMFRAQAERRTALGLLITEIVSSEKIAVDKDVVKRLVEEAASTYENPEEVVNYYYGNDQLLRSVEAAALEDQVVDFLLEKADVTEVTVSYEDLMKPEQKAVEDEA
ncbi:MAG: trigger factor [Alteromonadaceae bacterium]|nr:MAG: trigger factor [Alteromonadaceae bacterium]